MLTDELLGAHKKLQTRQGTIDDWSGATKKVNIIAETTDGRYEIEFPDCMTSMRNQVVSKDRVEIVTK